MEFVFNAMGNLDSRIGDPLLLSVGSFDKESSNKDVRKMQLENAAKDRVSDVGGEKVPIFHMLPDKMCLPRSWDLIVNFDAFAQNAMISPRPLLMITGTKVATKWYSEDGVKAVKDPTELIAIEGLTHADLYDKVDEAGKKLVEHFGKSLA